MNRVRDEERIKIVGPDLWVLPCPTPRDLDPTFTEMYENETEIWFDWAFVDFWKSNIREHSPIIAHNQMLMRFILLVHRHYPTRHRRGSEFGVLVNR